MSNCNNLVWSAECNDEHELDLNASNSSTDSEAVINLKLPVGTQIFNQAGELIAEIDGEPDFTKVRIPPGA